MDEYELLVKHAERWAAERARVLDAHLLVSTLHLRAVHDGYAANHWTASSVEHLMLTRWPAHGPLGTPDVDALVATLDTFWMFLRATGRLAAHSGQPADLRKAAKRAARQMPAACQDESRFGSAKSMLAFGQEVGILEGDIANVDELNEKMEQIANAWNALPLEDRKRRSGAGLDVNRGSQMSEALTRGATSFMNTGQFPPGWSLPEPPRLDEQQYRPNDPAISAPVLRSSGFMRSLVALAEWVGDGREVTATGVLRPALAREAYEALGLWSWDRHRYRGHAFRTLTEEQLTEHAMTSWRSSVDCIALDRLWLPATSTGLIEVSSTRASWNRDAMPSTDADWVHVGLMALLMMAERVHLLRPGTPLLGTLLSLQERFGGGPRTIDDLKDWWWNSPVNRLNGVDDIGDEYADLEMEFSDEQIDRLLGTLRDAGLWTQRGDVISSTPLGYDFVLMLMAAEKQGLMDGDG